MSPLLEIKNLSVSYKIPEGMGIVVRDVSFSVFKGDIVGLVGESGGGKTTIALSIIDLLPQNAFKETGTVVFDGEDITHMSYEQSLRIHGKGIGLSLQDALSSLNPVLSIGYQLTEVIKYHKHISSREAKRQAIDFLKSVYIEEPERVSRLYPHQLSGGMRQRVLLAMAIVCNPKVLILDEPTSSLDAITERSIIRFILDIKERFALTIIFISHNERLIFNICNRVLILHDGELIEKHLNHHK